MKNYTLKEYQGQTTLHQLDGTPVECIFKNPVVLPHPQIAGQMVIKATPCCNLCPAFVIINGDDTDLTELHLGCIKQYISITKEPTQLKII